MDIRTAATEIWGYPAWTHVQLERLERFAALVLERAAKLCEDTYPERVGGQEVMLPCYDTPTECAAAIRALIAGSKGE